MTRIKPFGPTHFVFDSPQEAIEYYESHAEREDRTMPGTLHEFLGDVAHLYPDALFAVQTAFKSNFITVARQDDTRPWLFARPDQVAVWTGTEKSAVALCEYWDELAQATNPSGRPQSFVNISPDEANDGGAMCAVMLAAVQAEKWAIMAEKWEQK